MIRLGGLTKATYQTRIRVWERSLSTGFVGKINYDYCTFKKILNLDKVEDDKKSVMQENFTPK